MDDAHSQVTEKRIPAPDAAWNPLSGGSDDARTYACLGSGALLPDAPKTGPMQFGDDWPGVLSEATMPASTHSHPANSSIAFTEPTPFQALQPTCKGLRGYSSSRLERAREPPPTPLSGRGRRMTV